MCPLFLRFLMNTYCNQQMRVKWNDMIYSTFSTSNGVKQGGVLSPTLFNVHLEVLYNIGSHFGFSSLNKVTKCISWYISIHEHAILYIVFTWCYNLRFIFSER